jgi:hypothetical protein
MTRLIAREDSNAFVHRGNFKSYIKCIFLLFSKDLFLLTFNSQIYTNSGISYLKMQVLHIGLRYKLRVHYGSCNARKVYMLCSYKNRKDRETKERISN